MCLIKTCVGSLWINGAISSKFVHPSYLVQVVGVPMFAHTQLTYGFFDLRT
jgi:hypothetical protein